MPNYEFVSKELHKNKRWKPISNFNFASRDALCPLVMLETTKAALHLPIAFSKTGEHFGLFAVQSFDASSNYLVDGEGRWLAGYIPAAYRGYPFALVSTDAEKQVLGIDTDSGLLNSSEGNIFFNEKDEPSAQIVEILDFLSQIAANHSITHTLCLMLEELDLLEPWPISIKRGEDDVAVEGLYRVNEEKFNSIDTDALANLRDKGALPLIFCQLISMQNLTRIAQLANPPATATKLAEEVSFDIASDYGSISFEGL